MTGREHEGQAPTGTPGVPAPRRAEVRARPLADALVRKVLHAERRLRLARALGWMARALSAGAVVAAVVLVLRKTGHLGEHAARVTLVVCGVQALVAGILGYAQRLPVHAGAVALDRFFGLSDRLASALSFRALPASEQTPFMLAAIDDALAHSGRIEPKAAVPLRAPRELPFLVAMACALAVIGAFEVRKHEPILTAQTIDAVAVTQDDLDAVREFLREVDGRLETDEAKAATQAFNQLIEDLANRRLDRTEAFRRMQALEDKLLEGREVDPKTLEEALRQMGEALGRSSLSKPAGEALENKNFAAAERATRDLANKLREPGAKIDKAQLDKLREALKSAGENQKARAEALAARRAEQKEQLLKQKARGAADEQERSLLQKRERELERLDRQAEVQQKAQRELERLDRALQKAAEDLAKDLGLSAGDLDSAAEDINRMGKQERTQQEREQLRQQLEQLRETLRQNRQGGQGQASRMRVFQRRARGQGGAPSGQSGSGEQAGESGESGEGEQGKAGGAGAQSGQSGQSGQGKQGQGGAEASKGSGGEQGAGTERGQGGAGKGARGETWVLGPNGEKIMLLSARRTSGGSGGSGRGAPGGEGHGEGHDPNVQGAATRANVGTEDTHVAGNDTGQGGSRSEVIYGASERGFASRKYERVFREYHTVAEEALDKDDVPAGYRFYVRRYFQLIRPRERGVSEATGSSAPEPNPAAPRAP